MPLGNVVVGFISSTPVMIYLPDNVNKKCIIQLCALMSILVLSPLMGQNFVLQNIKEDILFITKQH